jgi:SEC-C motif
VNSLGTILNNLVLVGQARAVILTPRRMINLGRNDPCHCGSGKKYKKCHLDADQRARVRIRQSQPDSESPSAFLDVDQLPKRLQQLSEQGSTEDRKAFGELLSTAEPILEYLQRREEVEAAAAQLEAHRTEFEKLAADKDRYLALAQAVFAEACFVPLRFAASDVQRAFDHVGYPPTLLQDERTVEILRAAILHVADKENRSRLAMSLLLRLPEFVAARRYLEAWLLQAAAVQTIEDDGESNVFLFQMFSYGYDAWAADKRSKDESLFRKLGFDPESLRAMSMDELDSWMQARASDPAQAGLLEAFLQEHPDLREESVANIEALERNSNRLFERVDSRFLHLSFEEIQPWLMLLNERLTQEGFLAGTLGGAASQESVRRIIEEVALPLMREMAEAIFTPDRIRQLAVDLRQYRRERFAASDQAAVKHATGAINYLEWEDSPGQNTFLLTLCWVSLDSAIKATAPENSHAED